MNSNELEKLKKNIASEGLKKIPIKSEYESLRFENPSLIIYTSGKVVYDEKLDVLVHGVLEKSPDFDYVIGTDETGKGEWYGPLVVTCVALKPCEIDELRKLGVRDSKTLKKDALARIARNLVKMDFARTSLVLMPKTYNKQYEEFKKEGKTLNDMLAWAHVRVIKDLTCKLEYKKARVIIDKFDAEKTEFRLQGLDRENLEVVQKSHAESEIPVAAASILAKYVFERRLDELNRNFGVDLRNCEPNDVRDVLPEVAKMHFKNVSKYYI